MPSGRILDYDMTRILTRRWLMAHAAALAVAQPPKPAAPPPEDLEQTIKIDVDLVNLYF